MKKYLLSVLVLVFVLFSFAPTLYEISRSGDLPSSRSFELVHNYITDYNFYLSRIRQGWEGRITLLETYTNEPHHGTLIQELYLLLGQLSRFIPFASSAIPYAYHVARAVLGFLLLSLISWIATSVFRHGFWQGISFVTVVTGFGWPLVSRVGLSWRLNNYMPWWTVLEPLQRITFIPHILAAQAGLLFLIMAGSSPNTLARRGNWLVLGVIAMMTGLAMPQALMTVYAVYAVVTLIEYVCWNGKKTVVTVREWFKQTVLPRMAVGVVSVWTILYFLPLLRQYPWKRLVDFERLHPMTFSFGEYLGSLGLALPLGIFGALLVLRNKDTMWYGMVSWATTVIALVYGLTFIPLQHPLRFTEMAAYIPLGFLTTYFFVEAIRMVRRVARLHLRYYGVIAIYTICFLSILYGVTAMYHQFLWQKDFVDMKVRAGWPVIAMNNYIVYPTKGFVDALSFIERETPHDAVILSAIVAGNYIPSRTGRRVYLGHENTSYKEEKVEVVKQFYKGLMTKQEAYAYMQKEGISYVFWGPQEQEQGEGVALDVAYPFLREVYNTSEVTIYSITP